MLEKITREEVPKEVWDRIYSEDVHFIEYYIANGMMGIFPDYLLVLEKGENGYNYGFVYNGNAPDLSEFGSFGIVNGRRAW